MSYTTLDRTTDGAFPVEFFEFTVPGTASVWRYCSSDQPEVLDGVMYPPEVITRSSVVLRASSVENSLTITTADTNPLALALFAGLSSRPVEVVVKERHRTDPALQAATLFIGLVVGVNFSGAQATITCGSRYTLASRRRIPHATFQAGCNWSWGGEGCGVNKAAYAVTSAVALENMTGRTLTVAAAAGSADGFFSGGYVKRASDGDTRFIEEHTGSALLLAYGWSDLDATSENVTLFPGCQKTEAHCTSVFNNLSNYLGYSRLPSINPYNRSAFYQTAGSEVYDPGNSWDAGNGSIVVLEDRVVAVGPVSLSLRAIPAGGQYWSLGIISLDLSGYIVFSTASAEMPTRLVGVVPGASWITPREGANAEAALFEVSVTATGAELVTWNPETEAPPTPPGPRPTVTAWYSVAGQPRFAFDMHLASGVLSAPVTIRIRETATGIVRAMGVITAQSSTTFYDYGGDGA